MVALTAFPPLMALMIRLSMPAVRAESAEIETKVFTIIIYVLSPCVACMMGVFLWATPAISSELEGRSWTYLSVRPYGPMSVLLGKYLVAITWALPVGIISSCLSTVILLRESQLQIMAIESALATVSCLAYAGVFLLIGVLTPKRAMLAGIAYAVVAEMVLALVPAAANLFTIQYRLRCLLVRWMELDFEDDNVRRSPVFASYFGDESLSGI